MHYKFIQGLWGCLRPELEQYYFTLRFGDFVGNSTILHLLMAFIMLGLRSFVFNAQNGYQFIGFGASLIHPDFIVSVSTI